jgi:hypothetical protein
MTPASAQVMIESGIAARHPAPEVRGDESPV